MKWKKQIKWIQLKSTLDDKSEQEYLYTQATVETNGNQNQIVNRQTNKRFR